VLLAVASVCLVIGVFLSSRWDLGLAVSLLLLSSAAALALCVRIYGLHKPALVFAGVAFVFVGFGRGACSPAMPLTTTQLRHLEGRAATVTGTVVSDPERVGDTYRLSLRGRISLWGVEEAAHLEGNVLVTLKPWASLVERRSDGAPRYGDMLHLRGDLSSLEPFGGFDFRAYLAQQGLLGAMRYPQASLVKEGQGRAFYRALFFVRRSLAQALERALPEPQSSLAQAAFLGLRRELPNEVNDAFIRTGTIHLLAVSGQHLTILLGMLLGGVQWTFGRRRWALALALAGIWLYAGVTGAAPPVVRAALMGTLVLWARFEGRPGSGVLALALASATMVAVEPSVLFSVSFQLNVASMAGLVLLAPPLQTWVLTRAGPNAGHRPLMLGAVRFGVAALAAGIGAALFTLPITAFAFHQVSLIGVPVTILALPVIPFMLVITGAVAVAGALWVPAGQVIAWVAWLPLTFLLDLVRLTAILG